MKKLKFNNPWMTLHVASKRKLHKVEAIVSPGADTNKNDLVTVAIIHGLDMLSNAYDVKRRSPTKGNLLSPSGLYIKSDCDYYPVTLIAADIDQANDFMQANPESGAIATDNDGRHYIAGIEAAFTAD